VLPRETLKAIIRTQTEIAAESSLERVMAVVCAEARALTGATAAVVELAEGDDMVYRAATGTAAPFVGLRIARAGSLSGLCVHEGRALRSDDTAADARVDREACRKVGVRSMVVVPLRDARRPVGAVKVCAPDPGAFTDMESEILEVLAGFVSQAIVRAELFDATARRALHDGLTGLANRPLLLETLARELAAARRDDSSTGLLFLDLDGFKPINDRHGHAVGDQVLVQTAARLQSTVRACDLVARVGGDEFVVLLPGLSGPTGLDVVADRIRAAVREPMSSIRGGLQIGVSIGCELVRAGALSAAELLARADAAMYADKRRRREAPERPVAAGGLMT